MTSFEMIAVDDVRIESDPNKGNMVILTKTDNEESFFLMFVGDSEFAAIAREKGLVVPKRPLTHMLYLDILERLPANFQRVEIYDMREGTFYANVYFTVEGAEYAIDSRPSDAVALALHRNIPVLVRSDLFRRKLTPDQIKEYEDLIKSVKF
jgi:bifunctional DNase/RNase